MNDAVLATSGATTEEGPTIGNSYLLKDLVARFGAQWDDDTIQRRDVIFSQTGKACVRGRVIVGTPAGFSAVFSSKEEMSVTRVSGMLILMRRKNNNGWKKPMLTVATTTNGMSPFH